MNHAENVYFLQSGLKSCLLDMLREGESSLLKIPCL